MDLSQLPADRMPVALEEIGWSVSWSLWAPEHDQLMFGPRTYPMAIYGGYLLAAVAGLFSLTGHLPYPLNAVAILFPLLFATGMLFGRFLASRAYPTILFDRHAGTVLFGEGRELPLSSVVAFQRIAPRGVVNGRQISMWQWVLVTQEQGQFVRRLLASGTQRLLIARASQRLAEFLSVPLLDV